MSVEVLPPQHEVFADGVREVVAFTGELKELCDDYFQSQEKERTTNYEDIAYVARQIEDGLLSEYEHPALLPLKIARRSGARMSGTALLATASIS